MTYEDLRLEIQNHVAIVTLQRPEKMNAMGPRLVHDMLHALESTARDDAVKAMVITGAGRGFCAGADVSGGHGGAGVECASSTRPTAIAATGLRRLVTSACCSKRSPAGPSRSSRRSTAPPRARACRSRWSATFASPRLEARFISAFVHRAINPDTGSTWYLPQMLGKGRALEMMYTGEPLSAQEAERYGMVNRVVDPEQLLPESLTLAEKIAKGPSIAIELTKRLVNESAPTFKMQVEREAWGLGVSGQSEDREEGIRSFLERRPAEFRGR